MKKIGSLQLFNENQKAPSTNFSFPLHTFPRKSEPFLSIDQLVLPQPLKLLFMRFVQRPFSRKRSRRMTRKDAAKTAFIYPFFRPSATAFSFSSLQRKNRNYRFFCQAQNIRRVQKQRVPHDPDKACPLHRSGFHPR